MISLKEVFEKLDIEIENEPVWKLKIYARNIKESEDTKEFLALLNEYIKLREKIGKTRIAF